MHAARANRRQQRRRIVGEQKEGGELRRLFQYLEQRVRRLFHEVGVAEDVNPLAAFGRLVVNLVDDVPHLVHLDQHLRRVGRNDEHVGMRLHQDAGFALVGVAQVLARLDGFGKALLQRVGLRRCERSWRNGRRSRAGRR